MNRFCHEQERNKLSTIQQVVVIGQWKQKSLNLVLFPRRFTKSSDPPKLNFLTGGVLITPHQKTD